MNRLLRLIIIFVFLISYFIVTLPVIFIVWLVNRRDPDKRARTMQSMAQWALRVIGALAGCHVTVKGHDNIPTDEPVLYICNHRSFFDVILTYPLCPGLTGYMSKKEIGKVPVLNIWMKALHCPLLDRSNIKEGLRCILECISLIRSGTSVFIFPEGTRNKTDGPLLPFKAGAFKIAQKTGCPIVPVATINTSRIFEDHFPTVRKTDVTIEFAPPVRFEDLSQEDRSHIDDYFRRIIQNMVDNNK